MGSSRNWFRLPFVYRPRAERRESPALAAFQWNGCTPWQSSVANISASGAFILTEKPWNVGEIRSLTLQRSGMLESTGSRRVTVEAKVVRSDREGAGVQFLMPRGSDLSLWQSAIKADVPQTEPEDVVREFRVAAAVAFIRRIAPEGTDRIKLLMRKELSNFRLASAVEIALHAEELLALEGDPAHLKADPSVVQRILEDGSWAETEWIQHYWAGVLAASCRPDLSKEDKLKSASLLSQITIIQARIFSSSCIRAAKTLDLAGRVSARQLTCSALELVQIANTHDRVHIERDIQHLVELGLIEKTVKWKFFSLLDQAVITPTELALDLYARCHGHRRASADFYAKCSGAKAVTAG